VHFRIKQPSETTFFETYVSSNGDSAAIRNEFCTLPFSLPVYSCADQEGQVRFPSSSKHRALLDFMDASPSDSIQKIRKTSRVMRPSIIACSPQKRHSLILKRSLNDPNLQLSARITRDFCSPLLSLEIKLLCADRVAFIPAVKSRLNSKDISHIMRNAK
jgi:hypothetical protein